MFLSNYDTGSFNFNQHTHKVGVGYFVFDYLIFSLISFYPLKFLSNSCLLSDFIPLRFFASKFQYKYQI